MSGSQTDYSTSRDHFWWFVFAMLAVLFLGFGVGDAIDGKVGQAVFDGWMVLFFALSMMLGREDSRRQHIEVVPNGPYAQARTRYDQWLEKKVHARAVDIISRVAIIVFVIGLLVFWRLGEPVLVVPPAVALVIFVATISVTVLGNRHYGRQYEQTHGIEDTWFFNIDETDPQAIADAEAQILRTGTYPQPEDGEDGPGGADEAAADAPEEAEDDAPDGAGDTTAPQKEDSAGNAVEK